MADPVEVLLVALKIPYQVVGDSHSRSCRIVVYSILGFLSNSSGSGNARGEACRTGSGRGARGDREDRPSSVEYASPVCSPSHSCYIPNQAREALGYNGGYTTTGRRCYNRGRKPSPVAISCSAHTVESYGQFELRE